MFMSPKIGVCTDRGSEAMSMEILQVEKFLRVGPCGEGFLGGGEGGHTQHSETKAKNID